MRNSPFLFLCLLFLFTVIERNYSQSKPDNKYISDFMDKRFGLFIHWGPVTLRGTEIGWSRAHQVSIEEYDNLYKEFNPVLFNANAWVKTAKDAGIKYITLTSKHHDGFCLWHTNFSDYNIMYSPFKRDIVGELAVACKKQGIAFCLYFTVLDWHDSNYPKHNIQGDTTTDRNANMDLFVKKMKNELQELITRYHPYMLWFDGNWESPWTKEYGSEIYQFIKKLDPVVIINNRLGKGKHTELGSETVGDYSTPEQFIGKLNMKDPWESCITICEQWAWKPNDKMKSRKDCIQTLVQTAAGNGNLLFNVGPMPDGRIEQRQINRLKEMGDWLQLYGESIYQTKGGPYMPNKNWATTRKDKKIYLHVFTAENNEVFLPAIKDLVITKSYFLHGESVLWKQNEKNIRIQLPSKMPNPDCSVIVLEITKKADTLILPY